MSKHTDSDYEVGKGRICVWLSEPQIELIIESAKIARAGDNDTQAQNWADIQFRLSAAKHKAAADKQT